MIGYNEKQINELMEKLEKTYNNICDTMADQWENVYKTMRNEWIGEDEYVCESKFAQELNELGHNIYEYVNVTNNTIAAFAESWQKMQQSNSLDFGQVTVQYSHSIEKPVISEKNPIVDLKEAPSIGVNDNRGLQSDSSDATIKEAISNYHNNVKAKVQSLLELDAQIEKAFLGTIQSSAIRGFVAKVSDGLQKLAIQVKKMYDIVDILVKGNYYNQEARISEIAFQSASKLDESSFSKTLW